MKRRTFGLLASTSLFALKFRSADAQSVADPVLLKTSLTPLGAERAGNAEGTIPAWSGGYTTIPDGWQQGDFMPDFFASEQPVLVIDAANMAQYSDQLSTGIQAMMKQYSFSIKVYPTHRTAAAPQQVYDNTALNVSRATLNPAGGRLGFLNAFGGIPFPIPNIADAETAGAQIIWNHNSRWCGYGCSYDTLLHIVSDGNVALACGAHITYDYPYYKKSGTLETFDGLQARILIDLVAPSNLSGEQFLVWHSTNPYNQPNQSWELLNGQGRVRKAPELSFDTPDPFTDGIGNEDETNVGFTGSLEEYDWKYIGKKEMFIPYNNNGMTAVPFNNVLLDHFIDPNIVRWELHRVWIVEATLHPGEHNVMARRVLYVDEDTWQIALVDGYDANNELFHVTICYNYLRPELPGLVNPGASMLIDMQTGNYSTHVQLWNEKIHPTLRFYDSLPDSMFQPESIAVSGQY
jgi:hypothetical protein